MFKREESPSAGMRADSGTVVAAPLEPRPNPAQGIPVAQLGRSVVVKGELTGSEDLTVDGRVEGRIDLPDHTLTIGPNASVQADIVAKVVTVFGSVVGGVTAGYKVDIRQGGSLEGHVACVRITIQDGGHFRGKVEMPARAQKHDEVKREAAVPVLAVTA